MNGSSRRRRPTSASSTGRPASAGVGGARWANKPKVDAQFIADPDVWDAATPHDGGQRRRPTSAPVYKRSVRDDDYEDDDNGITVIVVIINV